MPDIVHSCVYSKGNDDIQHLPSSNCMVVQVPLQHVIYEFVQLCVLSKGYDVMPRPMFFDYVFVQGL